MGHQNLVFGEGSRISASAIVQITSVLGLKKNEKSKNAKKKILSLSGFFFGGAFGKISGLLF